MFYCVQFFVADQAGSLSAFLCTLYILYCVM